MTGFYVGNWADDEYVEEFPVGFYFGELLPAKAKRWFQRTPLEPKKPFGFSRALTEDT